MRVGGFSLVRQARPRAHPALRAAEPPKSPTSPPHHPPPTKPRPHTCWGQTAPPPHTPRTAHPAPPDPRFPSPPPHPPSKKVVKEVLSELELPYLQVRLSLKQLGKELGNVMREKTKIQGGLKRACDVWLKPCDSGACLQPYKPEPGLLGACAAHPSRAAAVARCFFPRVKPPLPLPNPCLPPPSRSPPAAALPRGS